MPRATSIPPDANFYSAEQCRELDRRAIASGIPGFELMSRAGAAAFTLLQQRWSDCSPIEIFCGGGNNGGDGYIVAALAAEAGIPVRLWSLKDELNGDAALARAAAERAGVVIQAWQGELPQAGAVIVDALLGTGLSGEVREPYSAAIKAINHSGCPVLGVDIPSGLCSDTGVALGEVVRADITLSFIALKLGLVTSIAPEFVGELILNDLQIPASVYSEMVPQASAINRCVLQARLGARPRHAHKGMFGHVLVVGGDYGMAGAAILSASAAARCGAGLVSCATREENLAALLSVRPEVMGRGVEGSGDLESLLERASVLAVGPGLGQQDWGAELLKHTLATDVPVVLDADALNLIAREQFKLRKEGSAAPRVLTPHPAEAARLLGISTAEVQADRRAAVLAIAKRYSATVLLKGAGTLIAEFDQSGQPCVAVNLGGNPGMASGGMGDVLTGMIAALLAQGLSAFEATCLAASLHCRAADFAAAEGERGMLAMDVVAQLRRVIN
ncbi:NAD(P)H-hydrate dehydratase [Spongiibacter sp. KMU-158]|uniref:Bifunctional NAD(P)H-hydrate repair enzyme n=1 Tax=Spongiibacter pelagi TaxID=2760804 RepID=A0A927C160_9GAMM|nr:NAD(P)H-hydrate dehydratase [Spongiibacter pelagi]MBD2857901.1 NAD(P)H-hydrate dehydratase [Spongiibacter pelagi]